MSTVANVEYRFRSELPGDRFWKPKATAFTCLHRDGKTRVHMTAEFFADDLTSAEQMVAEILGQVRAIFPTPTPTDRPDRGEDE